MDGINSAQQGPSNYQQLSCIQITPPLILDYGSQPAGDQPGRIQNPAQTWNLRDLPDFFVVKPAKPSTRPGVRVETPEPGVSWPALHQKIATKIEDKLFNVENLYHLTWTCTKTGTRIEMKTCEDLNYQLKIDPNSEFELFKNHKWKLLESEESYETMICRDLLQMEHQLEEIKEIHRDQDKKIVKFQATIKNSLVKFGHVDGNMYPSPKPKVTIRKRISNAATAATTAVTSVFRRKSETNHGEAVGSRSSSSTSLASSSGKQKKVGFTCIPNTRSQR